MRSCTTPSSGSEVTPVYESRFQFHVKSRAGAMLCIIVYLGVIALLASLWACVLLAGFGTAEWSALLLVRNALLMPIFPLACLMLLHRLVAGYTAYRFEADGLYQKRLLLPEKRIPWTEFQQVCVCTIRPLRGRKDYPVIYFVRHEGTRFTCGIEFYPDGKWDMGRRGVLRIDCREDILAGLRQRCPLPIEDMRPTKSKQ